MSNSQFYLTIGIPTLAVLIGVLMNTIQLSSIDALLSSQDARFSSLETRITNLETRFDARFNNLEVKFDTLIGKVIDIDNLVTRIEAKLDIR
jgi:flagellar capping protein FliD